LTTHGREGLPCLLHCAKMRGKGPGGNFLLEDVGLTKLTQSLTGIASTQASPLCVAKGKHI
jgi:hypothetical protein